MGDPGNRTPRLRYDSKGEIYANSYELAIRFIYDQAPFFRHDYPDLAARLAETCGAKVTEFNENVANLRSKYPTSLGCWLSVPAGSIPGSREGEMVDYVLLGHETGPEIFVAAGHLLDVIYTAAVSHPEVLKLGVNKALEVLLVSAVEPLIKALVEKASARLREPTLIFVEIRSAAKGILRMPAAQFTLDRFICVLQQFPSIADLSGALGLCFGNAELVAFTHDGYP